MDIFLLVVRNLFRWIVLLIAVYALFNNFTGWRKNRTFSKKDKVLNTAFVGMLDLQLLLGLTMYFFYSNITKMAFENMGAAMKNKELRFWAIEHITGMMLALILAHVGGALSKRANSDQEKFRKAFVYFSIAMVLILLSMPYSFRGGVRPLNPLEHIQ